MRNLFNYAIIFWMFILIAAGGFYTIYVNYLKDYYEARHWEAASCRIESAHIDKNVSSNKGSTTITYKLNIQYQYSYQGQWYKGDRFAFFDFYTATTQDKVKIMADYPVDSMRNCYVDPQDPTRSVINREDGIIYVYLLLLIPLSILLIGIGGIYSIAKEKENHASTLGSITLSQVTPLQKLLTIFGIAGFWNTVVIIMVVTSWLPLYKEYNTAFFYESLFFAPFVAIGILLFISVFYQILALFNPNTSITLNSDILRPGENYTLNFYTTGKVERIVNFSISLIGISQETIREGKNTSVNATEFYEGIIYHQEGGNIAPFGIAQFTLPQEIEPSGIKGNIEIQWIIKVQGKIRYWPDINSEYPVRVLSDVKPKSFAKNANPLEK